ncbi:MAG: cytidylate kinase [Firmicutes bacterium HGW-Firmicutes-15]|nr:MAG: cytidylate kinase [Firmicutes bacterium HGW-Firmicutes-15]
MEMKIAIDGPAGAGKSTLSRVLARDLGFVYIDTGAMYRALTLRAQQRGINLHDDPALCALANSINIHFESRAGIQGVFCDGEDITDAIRSPEVNSEVSIVASHPQVREIMVKKQQNMAQTSNVIMDGRDIGEQVLPDAEFKFFLTAGLQERAQRRAMEMESQGYYIDKNVIEEDMQKRDRMDSEREVGALKILVDSIVIDTSERTADEVLAHILSIIGEG